MWHAGCNFLIFRLQCVIWHVILGNVDAGLWRYVGTLRRILVMMLCYDIIHDVTWHVRQGYKRTWRRVMGDTLVQLSLGKEVHVHAWIDALACPRWESLLPSNITDWVVLIRLCASAPADAPIILREWPGNAVFFLRSTASTGLLCLLVGARVHYL